MCNDLFAGPMLEDDKSLVEYRQQLDSLNSQGKLPDLDEEMWYNVYSIRGSSVCDHESVVLSTNNTDFVTVELGIRQAQGGKHIYPVSRALDSSLKHKFEYHGRVLTSGENLVALALETMREFGSYFKFCKNCQDYCNMYLKSIGLPKADY